MGGTVWRPTRLPPRPSPHFTSYLRLRLPAVLLTSLLVTARCARHLWDSS
jgi:hypothetical protein